MLVSFAALLVAPKRPGAQNATSKTLRIGILSPAEAPSTTLFEDFREGLRDRGYVDGQNITIEYRLPVMCGTEESVICQHSTSLPLARPSDSRPIWAKATQFRGSFKIVRLLPEAASVFQYRVKKPVGRP